MPARGTVMARSVALIDPKRVKLTKYAVELAVRTCRCIDTSVDTRILLAFPHEQHVPTVSLIDKEVHAQVKEVQFCD